MKTVSLCPYCGLFELKPGATICPQCQTEVGGDQNEAPDTRLVKSEDLSSIHPRADKEDKQLKRPDAAKEPVDNTPRWKPSLRPPLALLMLHDDGLDSGEEFRLRKTRTTIGRTDGDIRLEHDSLVSTPHAEVRCIVENDRYVWFLGDLGSTNGTFALVSEGLLRHNQEIFLGSRRYRFHSPLPARLPPAAGSAGTRPWSASDVAGSQWPSLVEISENGSGATLQAHSDAVVIGRDPRQTTLVIDDPFVSPRHARLYRDQRGRWLLQSLSARNGVWVRINRVRIEGSATFLMGEQRISVRVL